MNLEQARLNMIEQQIRPWDVLDRKILDVIIETPREAFVPEAQQSLAFVDMSLPLGHDEYMMEPKLEARLLQSLEIQASDTALEIGTGSGYLTACLARLAAKVHSIDIHEDFSQMAAKRLAALNIDNVQLQVGDAAHGMPESTTQYDVIAVTGSIPEYDDCFQQMLKPGGRLFIIVGDAPAMQATLVTRVTENDYYHRVLFETVVKPLIGRQRQESFEL